MALRVAVQQTRGDSAETPALEVTGALAVAPLGAPCCTYRARARAQAGVHGVAG